MNRWDIINKFIETRNYLTYKELGYYKGWSFDRINARWKVAIDPNPSKTPEMEQAPYGSAVHLQGFGEYEASDAPTEAIYKMTSDEFFEEPWLPKSASVFFIDGLHEHTQVYRDIQNCLKNLVPGGVIILHDMNPPTLEHTTTGIDGCWTGDAYKAFLQFQKENIQDRKYSCTVVDTDWGVGIIEANPHFSSTTTNESTGLEESRRQFFQRGINDWEYFDKHRKELLNLISVDEFLKKFEKPSSTNTEESTGHLIAQQYLEYEDSTGKIHIYKKENQ